MNQFKYIKDAFIRHQIEGKLDMRVTMSLKGIKVNFGVAESNKPNGFDLNQAIVDSCQIAVKRCEYILTLNTDCNSSQQQFKKWRGFCEEIIEVLSKQSYD